MNWAKIGTNRKGLLSISDTQNELLPVPLSGSSGLMSATTSSDLSAVLIILTANPWSVILLSSYFTDEEIEAQRGGVTCPKPHSCSEAELASAHKAFCCMGVGPPMHQ